MVLIDSVVFPLSRRPGGDELMLEFGWFRFINPFLVSKMNQNYYEELQPIYRGCYFLSSKLLIKDIF